MINIHVPVSGTLRKRDGWMPHDDTGFLYYVFRYHMLFRERQSSQIPRMGERLRQFSSPAGESSRIIESISTVERVIDFEETLSHHFSTSEELRNISSSIASEFGAFSSSMSAGMKARMGEHFSEGLSETRTVNRIYYKETTHKIKIERNIDSHVAKEYVAPAYYQEWCLDGYISHVDYLIVSYERRGWQITRRRVKKPDASKARTIKEHPNVIHLQNVPICCIKYWRPLPTSKWIEEEQYEIEVEYPKDVNIHMAERTYRGHYPHFSDLGIPTLYNLSEKAFPHKYDGSTPTPPLAA